MQHSTMPTEDVQFDTPRQDPVRARVDPTRLDAIFQTLASMDAGAVVVLNIPEPNAQNVWP